MAEQNGSHHGGPETEEKSKKREEEDGKCPFKDDIMKKQSQRRSRNGRQSYIKV